MSRALSPLTEGFFPRRICEAGVVVLSALFLSVGCGQRDTGEVGSDGAIPVTIFAGKGSADFSLARQWIRLLNKRSEGAFRLPLRVRAASTEKPLSEQLSDVMISPSLLLGNLDPAYKFFSLPFLFSGQEEAKKICATSSPTGVLPLFEQVDPIPLAVLPGVFRQISVPLEGGERRQGGSVVRPSDFQGLRVGTTDVPIYLETYRALGAVPLPGRLGKSIANWKKEEIGAIDFPLSLLAARQRDLGRLATSVLNTFYEPSLLVVRRSFWEELDEEEQRLMRETAAEVFDVSFNQAIRMEKKEREILRSEENFILELNRSEREALRRAVKPVYEKYSKETWMNLYLPAMGQIRLVRSPTRIGYRFEDHLEEASIEPPGAMVKALKMRDGAAVGSAYREAIGCSPETKITFRLRVPRKPRFSIVFGLNSDVCHLMNRKVGFSAVIRDIGREETETLLHEIAIDPRGIDIEFLSGQEPVGVLRLGNRMDSQKFAPLEKGSPGPLILDFRLSKCTLKGGIRTRLSLKFDSGRRLEVFLPNVDKETTLYVSKDGSTFRDADLRRLAQGNPNRPLEAEPLMLSSLEDARLYLSRREGEAWFNPVKRSEERWITERIDLSPYEGKTVDVTLMTRPLGRPVLPERRWMGEEDFDELSCLWGSTAISSEAEGDSDRNIIIVSLDTLRADRLGAYGYVRDTSPNIDRFAEEGALFENVVSPAPWTLPSHASLFTSLYPGRHGSSNWQMHWESALLPYSITRENVLKLADVLRRYGYTTAGFGELGYVSPLFGFLDGFDVYHGEPPPAPGLSFPFRDKSMKKKQGMGAYPTFSSAIQWLRKEAPGRFFLFIHTFETHSPYDETPYAKSYDPKYRGDLVGDISWEDLLELRMAMIKGEKKLSAADLRHINGLYDGEIRYTDIWLGKLQECLEEKGIADRTVVIILSDHGESFLDHDMAFEHGSNLFREQIRVPMLIGCPSVIKPHQRIETPVSLLDVFPTVLDYAGVPIPEGLEGKSLRPLLEEKAGTEMNRLFFSETVMDGKRVSCRDGKWKYIYNMLDDYEALYQTDDDPEEKKNIAEHHSDRVERYRKSVFDYLVDNNSGCYIVFTPGAEGGRVEGKVSTEGLFRAAVHLGAHFCDQNEDYAFKAGLREISFSFLLEDQTDGIYLAVEPSDATAVLTVEMDGEPLPRVFLGREKQPPGLSEFQLSSETCYAAAPVNRTQGGPATCYAWWLGRGAKEPVAPATPDVHKKNYDELYEQLKALGYVR